MRLWPKSWWARIETEHPGIVALRAFDEAHPEVLAEINERQLAREAFERTHPPKPPSLEELRRERQAITDSINEL